MASPLHTETKKKKRKREKKERQSHRNGTAHVPCPKPSRGLSPSKQEVAVTLHDEQASWGHGVFTLPGMASMEI